MNLSFVQRLPSISIFSLSVGREAWVKDVFGVVSTLWAMKDREGLVCPGFSVECVS